MGYEDPDWPDVVALQAGEASGLDRLMLRHRLPVVHFIRRMIGNHVDAEELAQEVFVRVYFKIGSYRPKAPFVAWMYRIARNLCRDYFRGRASRQRLVAGKMDRDSTASMERTDHGDERVEALQAALLKLPVLLRECVVLTCIEGFSHKETAARLEISAKAVEVRVYRGKKRLAEIMKKCEG